MRDLDITLFGTPRVERDGVPVSFHRHQTLALLAYLAVTDQPQSRDALAALFWPMLSESQAHAALRRALYDLGQAIGKEWLEVERGQVVLRPEAGLHVDIRCFRHLAKGSAAHNHAAGRLCDECLGALAQAADIYRGDLLTGFSLRGSAEFDDWQALTVESLRLELAGVLEKLASGLAGRRQFDRALVHAQRWTALDPLDEASHRLLMQLHAEAGDRAAAARQYRQCVKVLAAELGIEPAPETTLLHRALVSMAPPAAAPPHNLPADTTAFIGRQAALDQVAERLADPACRLLTVLGPGGIGKTRLAIQGARRAADRFAHGVCFVDLASVPTPELLSSVILRSLHIPKQAGHSADDLLVDVLKDRQMLLLLDNYEHLLTGSGSGQADGCGLISKLVAEAPQARLLVTSRARLNVPGEWLLPLEGLAVPPAQEERAQAARQARAGAEADGKLKAPEGGAVAAEAALSHYSATALCLDCIRRVRPSFRPTAAEAQAIARICRLVEGAPLAIELAAAWARILPLAEIARRLEHGLDLLVTTLQGVPARQRSMAATFDHSWRLLGGLERNLLRQLAVFRGGFTAQAAAAVAGASLEELATLTDASWLRLTETDRYAVHELVRQYCAGQLDGEHAAAAGETADVVRRRHAAYYAAFLAEEWSQSHRREGALTEVGLESGNLLAAWNWALADDDLSLIWALSHGLSVLTFGQGLSAEAAHLAQIGIERLRTAQTALRGGKSRTAERAPVLALMLADQGGQNLALGRLDDADRCLREAEAWLAQSDAGDPRSAEIYLRLKSLWAEMRCLQGDAADGYALWLAWMAEWRKVHRAVWPYTSEAALWSQLDEYGVRASVAHGRGDYAEARHLFTAGQALAAQSGYELSRARFSAGLAWVLFHTGEYRQSEQEARRALRAARAYGALPLVGEAYHTLGWVMLHSGQQEQAGIWLGRGLALGRKIHQPSVVADCRRGLGYLELAAGHPNLAYRHFQESLTYAGRPVPPGSYPVSLSVLGLGRVALHEGNRAEAQACFRQVLQHAGGTTLLIAEGLAGMAEALIQGGELARPAELCGFGLSWPGSSYQVRVWVKRLLGQLEASLQPAELRTALERGQLLGPEQAVAQALAAR